MQEALNLEKHFIWCLMLTLESMGLEHIFKTENVFKGFYCTQTVNKELVATLVCAFFKKK